MLKCLELENFKAFGERQKIPFAPITLIFGPNSSGKSSILQALYLLKQTKEHKNSNSLLVSRIKDGIVDMGTFSDYIFDHKGDNLVSIKLLTIDDYSCSNKVSTFPRKKEKLRSDLFENIGSNFSEGKKDFLSGFEILVGRDLGKKKIYLKGS
jgi:predicted ATP-dependent endonuclease of OLD family